MRDGAAVELGAVLGLERGIEARMGIPSRPRATLKQHFPDRLRQGRLRSRVGMVLLSVDLPKAGLRKHMRHENPREWNLELACRLRIVKLKISGWRRFEW